MNICTDITHVLDILFIFISERYRRTRLDLHENGINWIGLRNVFNRCRFFDFLISVLNIWKDLKVLSRFIQKLIQPPARSDHGLYICKPQSYQFCGFCHLSQCCGQSSIFVWITEYCIQAVIRTLRPGNYSGLDCGLLIFFKHSALTSRNPKNNCWLSCILEHDLAEKIAVCAHTTCVPNK